ncbi:AfsR/SARP family transcriptional regulator [Micromonospora echinofusca]|uniref:AAA family ATPase n=1 Tax=Micromonospora echinofusca TaxID=47858 RepID=A0ABS3VLG0_MICEH|nr:BTAD domain-containing putative transcriptional regulator [Micromonospora echinofusca]MBO4205381.1 AAA family ATPase [Micromonospora echinofusca]
MEFRVLGPVGAFRDGVEIALDGAKQRTVLAALLLADGRSVSDTRLCELLWGERPPATFAAQLYNYVSRLRKYLGATVDIVRQWSGYQLRTGHARLDIDEFNRLAELGREALRDGRHGEAAGLLHAALDLWRGPALSNVTEHLLGAESHRLAELRMTVLESRIEADLLLGRHVRLIPELTQLVAAQPLHEGLRGQLMTALVRCDRQADALATYHEGRQVLADELGVDPGPALAEAYRSILAGPVTPVPPARVAGESGWHGVRPAMLPPGVGDFTGRDRELDRLTRVLTAAPPASPAVALLTGMAGVGKSTLALHAAHLSRADFPDGQLYADLGGTRGNAVEPYDVLGWFLRGLGQPEPAIPKGLDERVRLYRSQLAGRRVLVMLDGAANYAQLRPLLPGDPACRVIVTSRTRLPELAGAASIEVDTLDRTQALALFERIVGADRVGAETAAAHRIVALCGRLTLGVRVAGSRLLARPHWSLGYLADRLADERFRLDELRLGTMDVRERLEGSYLALAAPGQLALRRLALLDTPAFPSWAAAEVLGVSRQTGEEVAEHLVDARLLEIVDSDGGRRQRHRFHDLVRVFAREKADQADRLLVAGSGALCGVPA